MTLLGDRFELGPPITSGGMGTVHRGVDRQTGRPVAIKVLREPGGQLDIDRFVREGEILSGLDHPSIVRYISRGAATAGGQQYLVMEWVEGETLASRLTTHGLTARAAVEIARQLATALGVVHEHGLVHRDLKPANVILLPGPGEQVKLIDFGISRLVDDTHGLTHTGAMLGTPAYMAPEQALGQKVISPRTDVFALGCVLYECLTGRPAFAGTQLLAIRTKVILTDPPRPRAFCPEMPEALEELLMRMLAKEPDFRPAGGAELAQALATIPAPGPGPARRRSGKAIDPANLSQLTTMTPPGQTHVRKVADAVPAAIASEMISIVLASRAEEEPGDDGVSAPPEHGDTPRIVADVAKLFNGRASIFPDGAFALAFRDDPKQAVRCAMELSRRMADVSVVVTSEQAGALDPAVDRAVQTLSAATMEMIFSDGDRGVDVDAKTAQLVGPESEMEPELEIDASDPGRITVRPR